MLSEKYVFLLISTLWLVSIQSRGAASNLKGRIRVKHNDVSDGPGANAQQSLASAATPNGFGNLPPASVSRFVPETSGSWRGNDALRFSSTYAQVTA